MATMADELAILEEACQRRVPRWVGDVPPGTVVGLACSYAPLELFHAAGLTPLRLQVPGRPAPAADSWLPPFTCAPVRGLLGAALEGQLDSLAGFVVPHSCDTMQELAGIWQTLRPDQWLLTPVEPLAVESPRAPAYLRQELLALAGCLAEHLGRPVSDDDLAESIARYNRLRQAVQAVDGLRDRLSATQAWAAISAAWRMPPETYLQTAGALIDRLQTVEPAPASAPAVLLAGSVLDEPLIPELVDELGGRVVGDDLCNGTRDAQVLAAESGDPWSALAERLLQRLPCPCKHTPGREPGRRLAELARRRSAQGVIQILAKFCDPHSFDLVPGRQRLAAAGVAQLALEIDATNAPEQLRTRLQAFFELLRAAG